MAGEFIITLGDESQIPDLLKGPFVHGKREPRIAMVGRSNVGKSSLINALLRMKAGMARVSKQPGKTRQINFYLWKEAKKILADLPGYGYAKAGFEERERWGAFVNQYLRADENLERAVVLLDARHGPTEIDMKAIQFMSLENIPVTFVFTKYDQLKTQKDRAARKKEAVESLKELGYQGQKMFWVSIEDDRSIYELEKELLGTGESEAKKASDRKKGISEEDGQTDGR